MLNLVKLVRAQYNVGTVSVSCSCTYYIFSAQPIRNIIFHVRHHCRQLQDCAPVSMIHDEARRVGNAKRPTKVGCKGCCGAVTV